MKISKEIAYYIWVKNVNLSKELTGRVHKPLALSLTHSDLEAIKAGTLSANGNLKVCTPKQ